MITDRSFLSPPPFALPCLPRSKCLGPRPAELSSSLEQSGHRSQPDLYLWAAVAGRVYVTTPAKPTCLGNGICLRAARRNCGLFSRMPMFPPSRPSSGSAPFSYLGKHCHLVDDATKHNCKHSRRFPSRCGVGLGLDGNVQLQIMPFLPYIRENM